MFLSRGAESKQVKTRFTRALRAKARGVWGHAPPGKFWSFRPSESFSSAFSRTFWTLSLSHVNTDQ